MPADLIDDVLAIWRRPAAAAAVHDQRADARVVVLAASTDFWEDDDGVAAQEAGRGLEERRAALLADLTAAWGEPRQVNLTPLIAADPAAPLADLLLTYGAAGGTVWDRGDRSLLIAIGQVDKEFAMELFALDAPNLPGATTT